MPSLPASLVVQSPLTATREIWRSGEKLLKSYRLFGRGHQNIRGFVADFAAKLDEHFSRFGPVDVELVGPDVLVAGERVLRDEAADRNFVAALSAAGVLRVRFEPGMNGEEVERLFRALSTDSGKAGEDDLLTALWVESLPHFKWVAINELDAADPKDETNAQWIRVAFQMIGALMEPKTEKRAPRPPSLADIARDGIAELARVPPPPWDKVTVRDDSRSALLAALAAEGPMGERAAAYTLEAVKTPRDEDVLLMGAMLMPALRELVARREFGRAEELLASFDRWQLSESRQASLLGADAAALTADALHAAAEEGYPDAAMGLLRRFGAGAVPGIVGTALQDPSNEALAGLLRAVPDAACEALQEKLGSTDEAGALAVVALASKIGGAPAIDVFDSAAAHASSRVASEARRKTAPPSVLSPRRAASQITSADGGTRRNALDFLIRKGARSAAVAIETACGTEQFRGFEEKEKRSYMGALLRLDRGRAVAVARRLLAEKSLLGGARIDETRGVAAWVLGEGRDEESLGDLDAIANGRGRAELKNVAAEAAAKIRRGRPA